MGRLGGHDCGGWVVVLGMEGWIAALWCELGGRLGHRLRAGSRGAGMDVRLLVLESLEELSSC